MINLFLVRRLMEYIDPFDVFQITHKECVEALPVLDFKEGGDDRGTAYDVGRINYFMRQFMEGKKVDPITMDCDCSNGRVHAIPIIIDGHHRFAGAILGKANCIKVSFGGRVDLCRYLEGLSDIKPEY